MAHLDWDAGVGLLAFPDWAAGVGLPAWVTHVYIGIVAVWYQLFGPHWIIEVCSLEVLFVLRVFFWCHWGCLIECYTLADLFTEW